MGFYSENRSEYIVAELACIAESITLEPISARPTDSYYAKHILSQTQLDTIFVSGRKVTNLLKIITEAQIKSVKTLIIVEDSCLSPEDLSNMKLLGICHYPYAELLSSSTKSDAVHENLPTKDFVYLICYSSGTTADPKGAMLTH